MFDSWYQVSFVLNAWRATQSNQHRICQSLMDTLYKNQMGEECNMLIASLEGEIGMMEDDYKKKNLAIEKVKF